VQRRAASIPRESVRFAAPPLIGVVATQRVLARDLAPQTVLFNDSPSQLDARQGRLIFAQLAWHGRHPVRWTTMPSSMGEIKRREPLLIDRSNDYLRGGAIPLAQRVARQSSCRSVRMKPWPSGGHQA
jgi:hypothetical protein